MQNHCLKELNECSYDEFQYALSVGVTAPFYLTKLFQDDFGKGGCIIQYFFIKRWDESASK